MGPGYYQIENHISLNRLKDKSSLQKKNAASEKILGFGTLEKSDERYAYISESQGKRMHTPGKYNYRDKMK